MTAEVEKKSKTQAQFVLLPLIAIVLHTLCVGNYGYFRDELYYLSCANRLDWGYVDHPPLSIALLRLVTLVFGDSLAAIRAPMVLASGLTVLVVMATARRLGAGRVGTTLAGLCVLLSGMFLVIFSFYSMNGLDILLWSVAAYLCVRLCEQPSVGTWCLLGLVVGIGLLNKASVLMLVLGLGAGFVLSPLRKELLTPGPWVGLAIAVALVAPHIQWQWAHGWPTREFAENALREKMLPISPWEFLGQQAVVVNVFAVPVVLAGVAYGLSGDKSRWIAMSVVFLTVLLVLIASGKSRVNYLAPAYVFVIPLGSLAIERWLNARKLGGAWAYVPIIAISPLYLSLGLPWLPPTAMVWLISKSPVQPPSEEKGEKSPMQGWADMFGWPELARDVRSALDTLPSEDRIGAAVVTKNYGEAAALEHFGVTRVLSGHNAFWSWGPQDWDGGTAVFVNTWPDEVTRLFDSFERVGSVDAPWAVPEQDGSPIWIARRLRVPVPEFWRRLRKFQ